MDISSAGDPVQTLSRPNPLNRIESITPFTGMRISVYPLYGNRRSAYRQIGIKLQPDEKAKNDQKLVLVVVHLDQPFINRPELGGRVDGAKFGTTIRSESGMPFRA